jgi:hypothetical protein
MEKKSLKKAKTSKKGTTKKNHSVLKCCTVSVKIYVLGFVIYCRNFIQNYSVRDPDPDPPGSEIIWPQGSGYGSEIINFGSGSGSGSGSRSFPFSYQT